MTLITAAAPPLYLLDTNILVRYVRRDALGQRIEAAYSLLTTPTIPLISIVTEGEIRSLAKQLNWGALKRQQMGFFLTTFSRVSLEYPGLLESYAQIDTHSKGIGFSMGKNDIWIAATANVTGATLLTTDTDFDHLDPAFLQRDRIDPRTP